MEVEGRGVRSAFVQDKNKCIKQGDMFWSFEMAEKAIRVISGVLHTIVQR